MFEDRIDGLLVAVDDLQHARGRARFVQQFGEALRHARRLFARLQDEAIAAGDRDAEHPHRDHRGKIERRDAGDHAQRLAQRIDVDARPRTVRVLALHQMRDAAGELDHFQSALEVAFGIGKDLAVLARQFLRDLVEAFLDQRLEGEHHPRAPLRVHARPCRKRGLRIGDRTRHFLARCERHPRLHLARRWIEHVAETAARARDVPTADEMRYFLHDGLAQDLRHSIARDAVASKPRCGLWPQPAAGGN